jgi:DNA-binding XRE family transcriptional regulator
MGRKEPTVWGQVLKRLRMELDLTEEEAGQRIGVSRKVFHNLENGWQKLNRERLEEILRALDLPPAAIDMALGFGTWVQATAPSAEPVDPETEDRRQSEHAAGLLGLAVAKAALPLLLQRLREERIRRDRHEAEKRGKLLLRLKTPQERRDRIEDAEDYQTWALVEWLAHQSIRAAADDPARAVEVADLALFTVPFVPGPEARRKRLEGYARGHLGNALRVRNELERSDAEIGFAWEAWRAGAGDDFLPLEEGRLLDLEASLRREQRRFELALRLHCMALEISPEERAGHILLNQSATYEQMGQMEASVAVLERARPYLEKTAEPRTFWGLLFNLALNMVHLGRYSEAEILVADVRSMALQRGNELDLVRVQWLTARIDSGLGRAKEASESFRQVFENLVAHKLPYDAALAGLDLAIFDLKSGDTLKVMNFADQMKRIFRSFGIEREAMSALLIFCQAARQEQATIELARQTAAIIEKARRSLPRSESPEGAQA